jgi:hypothetical protein
MKDILLDIVEHTRALEGVELLRVEGTDQQTEIIANATGPDTNLMVSAILKNPIGDFIGTFGMPNLNNLSTILSFEDYDSESTITVKRKDRDGVDTPDSIHFETKNSDFVNDYRLMPGNVVVNIVKKPRATVQLVFNVEFTPSIASIQRLKRQASANSNETTFVTKLEGTDLKVYFGDHSSHSGNFVFNSDTAGKLSHGWAWPIKQVLAILNLAGDKTFKISDQGLCEIVVDSGLAVYTYRLPANQK